ncbi:GNAT family N-acetyltransferase [Seonamhaeicola marinus]|uniref:GNAT family N-acetyltransferase n=1 Tax=Seonamhaeicola marinus TaxID=1912246 RepID=A0A5D0J9K5_9FLAO|nr:GNAT family N-acetyltransferase [Seonamhaeicola marinus]TYA92259.1 GNAT family N-acetyltransferase [Seonamhaeicola marinus]
MSTLNKLILEKEETERLIFRPVTKSDFSIWLEFFKTPITSLYWEAESESPDIECTKWYEKQFYRYENNLGGMNALIEKSSGRLIGHCGLLIQNVDGIAETEIGYSLLPEFWHKGYATEAAKKCKDFAFKNNLTTSLISIISLTNKPSENVALKNGMHIDKTTVYNKNKVNIFRINRTEW